MPVALLSPSAWVFVKLSGISAEASFLELESFNEVLFSFHFTLLLWKPSAFSN